MKHGETTFIEVLLTRAGGQFKPGRQQPIPWPAFDLWMEMLMAQRGADLLRFKGLIHLQARASRGPWSTVSSISFIRRCC
ncbi:hypothetical protein DPM13_12590 [Paracoccus mutanolyticus]|uniref:CobW C-terminal domain-containing protein n=1 Tax=Paracoccus mutanolyticus TaxID=1499308 RepID=A0ABM6WSM1_9RHOB|nr:GTP-binding protein [Paracoccus mutanolyticus]AWX93634.1 hypothetical protein DPM13_12590 [Paracoccus mutanolyticus]